MTHLSDQTKPTTGTLLIVDDEEALRFFVADAFIRADWHVHEAATGEEALAALEKRPYDVILLDLRMPGMGGVAVMQKVKERWPETMIIVITAYASIDSAVEAVRANAFDYLRKPCPTDEVVACVYRAWEAKQALKNSPPGEEEGDAEKEEETNTADIHTGKLAIHIGGRQVWLAERPINLTPTEFELLSLLAAAPGQPVPRNQLIAEGLNYDPDDLQAQETLRVHISRLRGKLGNEYILTIRGGGYALASLPLHSP